MDKAFNLIKNYIRMPYNVNTTVTYETDEEYRAALQLQLDIVLDDFLMEQGTVPLMTEIFSQTADHPIFIGLYTKSAALMFSTNLETGLVVLFCYDFFHVFHKVLCDFYNDPATITESNEHVIKLQAMFK
jgi:hypothetical protein